MITTVNADASGIDSPTPYLTEQSWPRQWRAHWIGAEPPGPVVEGGPNFHVTHGGPFTRHLYRRQVVVTSVPATAPLRVTADSRYALYVNGVAVGRGPVRSQPRRMRYDSYDIAPLLHAGSNTVVVLITYYGRANSFWQPSAVNENLGNAGVLALELQIADDEWIVTDETWQVLATTAWDTPDHDSFDGVPVEHLDARRLDPGWKHGTGDGWRDAAIRPAGHLGALARSQPPTDPYGPLLPRPIGGLGGDLVAPVRAGATAVPSSSSGSSPVAHVLAVWAAQPQLTTVDPSSISVDGVEGQSEVIEVDFGRVVVGFVQFRLDAPAGTVVDLLYREKPADPGDTFVMSVPKIGARYVARGHDDTFQAQEVNGFRLAQLVITTSGPGPVVLRDLSVREHLYPEAGEAYFRCSDDELNRLYTAGRRTVAANAADAYTDCPTREQRAWVGDGIVHQHVHLTTSTDWRMARWYVELGNSPRPDGILPMSVVGEIEHSQQHTIPDWSLNWVHGVHNLHRYDPAAADLIAEALPTARRILEWYRPYLTAEGVIADVPEWNLVDWSSICLTGASSILTALWARGLREYAEISDHLGNRADASWADVLWHRVRDGFGVFWDDERGTMVDHLVDGRQELPASQLAGATAILAGLVEGADRDRVITWISDPDRLVTRSWIGGGGGYDTAKIVDQINGIQRIDWDAAGEVVRAEPFAAYHVHDAYRICGRPDLIIDSIRGWSEFLHDGYDTFGECWGWGTPVHGWSSTPTKDLITAVLGVTPDGPGFERALVAPAYGVVAEMSGATPTPSGLLTVTVRGDDVAVDSPVPYRLVHPDGTTTDHEARA